MLLGSRRKGGRAIILGQIKISALCRGEYVQENVQVRKSMRLCAKYEKIRALCRGAGGADKDHGMCRSFNIAECRPVMN